MRGRHHIRRNKVREQKLERVKHHIQHPAHSGDTTITYDKHRRPIQLQTKDEDL